MWLNTFRDDGNALLMKVPQKDLRRSFGMLPGEFHHQRIG